MTEEKAMEILRESLTDHATAKYLEEIGNELDDLANEADDPAKKFAYRIVSLKALGLALELASSTEEKLLTILHEDEAE